MATPASPPVKTEEKIEKIDEKTDEDLSQKKKVASDDGKSMTNNDKQTSEDESFRKKEKEVPVVITTRPEADGGNEELDEVDGGGVRPPIEPFNPLKPSTFPTVGESIPDINFYQHKKTLAKGFLDLALFSANANQLRYVLECYDRHPFYYPSLIFICFSLICQVVVGMLLLWNAMYSVKDEMRQANRSNNFTIIGVFLVTVVNVFISAFGVANPPPPG